MSLSKSFNCLLADYKSWVRKNPKKVKYIENYSAIVLSLFAGKITSSKIPYDWVSSSVKLIAFFNNNILHSHSNIVTNNCDTIKVFITILEYFEVTFERTVQHLLNERERWSFIIVSQCIKFLSKFALLFYYKERFICSPYTILKPNIEDISFEKSAFGAVRGVHQSDLGDVSVLKRSGRVIRKLTNVSHLRTWEPLILSNSEEGTEIDIKQLLGELLYIIKPLLNFLVIKKYGYGTWKPWFFSLLMDIASIHLITNPTHKRNSVQWCPLVERKEITTRRYLLLLYLLRSPFYERHTENRLKNLLNAIPIFGSLSIAQLDFYLPMYFTLWSK